MKLYKEKQFYTKLITEAKARKIPSIVYRAMSLGELVSIMSENAFSMPLSLEADSDGKVEYITDPKGNEWYSSKSFATKVTKDLVRDFSEADEWAIVQFNVQPLTEIPDSYFGPYVFDTSEYATKEYEWRLFFNKYKLNLPGELNEYISKVYVYGYSKDRYEEFQDDYGYDLEDLGIPYQFKK